MKSSGEAVQVSYTVATLDARSEFARLRRLLAPFVGEGSASVEAREECERLVDVLTDAYHAQDGMVDDESYMAAREGFQDEISRLEDELCDREAECEKLGGVVAELQDQLKASPDQLRVDNAELVAEKAGHEAELERARGMAKRERESADRYAKEASEANAALNAANYRMASWSTDKKAVETADHYREKYELATQRESDLTKRINSAFVAAHHDAGKRKAVHEGIDMVHNAFMYGPKGAKL